MKYSNNLAGYIANLGKSVVYSSVDVFNEATPSLKGFKETNSDLFKDVYHSVKDYKTTFTRGLKYVKDSKIYEAADAYKTNIFEDLKTGKFYNHDRIDKVQSDIVGGPDDMSLDSLDFSDMDFDLGDFDEYDPSEINLGDKAIATTVASSSLKNASMVANSIANTGEYIAETNKASTNLLYTQSIRGFNSVNSSITKLDNSINNLLSFNTTNMQNHLENSLNFFKRTQDLLEQQTALLTKIAEKVAPSEKEQREKEKKLRYGDVMGANGALDIKQYLKHVKSNITNEFGAMGSMMNMFGEDSNVLMEFVSSPLKFIPDIVAKKIIPGQIQKSLTNFDKSVSGFFSSLLTKFNTMANDDESNILYKYLGKFLKTNNSVKSSIDTSKYEKGKIDWDGKSKKALVEVIPTQLAKIISLLSGKPEQVFDYEKGTFISSNELKKSFDSIRETNIKSATSDMNEMFNKYMERMQFESRQQREDLQKDIQRAFGTMYNRGILFDTQNKNDNAAYNLGMSEENYNIMRAMFKSTPKYMQQQINANIMETREMENRYIESLMERNSVYGNLYNNSNLGEFSKYNKYTNKYDASNNSLLENRLKIKDNLGHDVYYYLQNMYRELIWQRKNGGLNILGGNSEQTDISDIKIKNSAKQSEASRYRMRELNQDERFLNTQKKRLSKQRRVIELDKLQDSPGKMYAALSHSLEFDDLVEDQKYKRDNPGVIEKLMNKSMPDRFKSVLEFMDTATSKPAKIADKVINRVDRRLYELIYGKEDTEETGLFNVIINKTKDLFFDFNQWINEKILDPIKKKYDADSMKGVAKNIIKDFFGIDVDETKKKINDYLFGDDGFFTNVKEGIKNAFKSTGEVIKNAFTSVFTPVKDFVGRHRPEKKQKTSEEILKDIENKSEENIPTNIDEAAVTTTESKEEKETRRKRNLKIRSAKKKVDEIVTTSDNEETRPSTNNIIKPSVNIFTDLCTDIKIIRSLLEKRFGTTGSGISISGGTLDANLLAHPEGSAYTDFANALSTNIANFMFGRIPKYAEGTATEVPETQIASLSKGEIVMSVKEKEDVLNAMEQISSIIGSGVKNNKKAFKGQSNKLYTELSSNKDLYDAEFNGMPKSEFVKLLKNATPEQMNQVKGNIQGYKTDYGPLDENGIPINKEYAKLYMDELSLAKKTVMETKKGLVSVSESLFGLGSKDNKEKVKGVLNDVTSKFTQYAPEAIGGSLIGAGVGLLPGIIGGPILGAAVGASISLVKQSDKAKEWLFGKEKDGEREGGVITKKFMKSASKYLPDMKNFGIVGGIGGLLPIVPFGPVGGLILGSTIGFAKNTESVKKGLFGDDKLLSEKNRNKLKDTLPKMGAGALVGTLIGPFGLVGNAVVGSAVGYLSTMEKFQQMILGKKDENGEYQGGLLPTLRKITIDPLKKLFTNLKDNTMDFFNKSIVKPVKEALPPIRRSIELTIKKLGSNMASIFGTFLNNKLGIPLMKKLETYLLNPIGKVTGGIGKLVKGVAKFTIGAPFAAIGEVGRHIKRNQIKAGQANYMSAQERLDYRNQKRMFNWFGNPLTKMDKFKTTDTTLANMSDEDLEQLMSSVNMINNTSSELKNKRQAKLNQMGEDISSDLKLRHSKKIMKNIVNGDMQGAFDYIDSNDKISDKKKEDLKAYIQNNFTEFAKLDMDAKNAGETSKRYKKEFLNSELFDSGSNRFLGFDKEKMGKEELNYLFDYIQKESQVRKSKQEELEANKTPVDKMTDVQIKTKDMIHDQHIELMDKLEGLRKTFEESMTMQFDENGRQIKLKKNSNGLYEPDTTVRSTFLAMKEAKNEDKEQTSQTSALEKISEVIDSGNDKDKEEKEPKKKKSFLSKLLGFGGKLIGGLKIGGAILGGLGALGFAKETIFPAVKGIWTEHLKPWVDSTVKPFITEKVVPTVGGWIASGFGLIVGEVVPILVKNIIPFTFKVAKQAVASSIKGVGKLFGFGDTGTNKDTAKTMNDKYDITVDDNGKVTMNAKNQSAVRSQTEEDIKTVTKKNGLDMVNNTGSPTPMDSASRNVSSAQDTVNSITDNSTEPIGNDQFEDGSYKPKYMQDKNGVWYEKNEQTQTYDMVENPETNPYLTQSKSVRNRIGNLKDDAYRTGRYMLGSGVSALPKLANKSVFAGAKDAVKYGGKAMGNAADTVFAKFGYKNFVKNAPESGSKVWNYLKTTKTAYRGKSLFDSGKNTLKSLDNGARTFGSIVEKGREKFMNTGLYKGANELLSKTGIDSITKNAGNKLIKKGQENLAKAGAEEAVEATVKSTASSITEKIIKAFHNLFTNDTVKGLLKADNIKEIVEKAIPEMGEKINKQLLESTGKMMGKAGQKLLMLNPIGLAITAGFAVADFISGYNDAMNILGITDEATTGEKVMCGLIKAISGIGLVSSLIGEKFWVDLFTKYILPIFNKSGAEELKQKKDIAKAKVEEYNEKYSTDYSVKEYNKNVQGKKSFFDKAKDWLFGNKNKTNEKDEYGNYIIRKESTVKSNTYVPSTSKGNKGRRMTGLFKGGDNKRTSNIRTINPFTNSPIPNSKIPFVGNTSIRAIGGEKSKWMQSNEPQWKGNFNPILGMGGASSQTGFGDESNSSGTPVTITSGNVADADLRGSLGREVTAKEMDDWIDSISTSHGGKMTGMGAAFIKAGKASGLDPRYIAAHAAWETGWGQSHMVKTKNNWFGIAAYNSNPDAAYTFNNPEDGIIEGGKWIAKNFINAGQPSLRSMVESKTHAYAVNDDGTVNYDWMNNIGSIIMGTPGIGPGNTSLRSSDGSISGSMSGDSTTNTKPSVFTLFSDLSGAASNVLNKLYGFDTTDTTSSGSASGDMSGTGSLDTSAGSIADKWFADTLSATVTSPYSYRNNPFSGQSEMHSGIDYSSGDILGKDIKSPIAGTVSANLYEGGGFGNYVVLTDKNQNDHYFGHMKDRSPLSVGAKVNVGDIVGKVGTTGSSTGPHVHYEIRNHADTSKRYDPNVYLKSMYGNGINEGGDPTDPAPRETIEETVKKYIEMEDNIKSNRNQGGGDGNVYSTILQSIVKVLLTISDNTSCLSQIVTILTDKLGVEVSEDMKKKLKNGDANRQTIVNMIQDQAKSNGTGNISNDSLYQMLQQLARE